VVDGSSNVIRDKFFIRIFLYLKNNGGSFRVHSVYRFHCLHCATRDQ